MTTIKELEMLAKAANLPANEYGLHNLYLLKDFRDAANPQTILELCAVFRQMVGALEAIKARVCGDLVPNWTDYWTVTRSRGVIADDCDNTLYCAKEMIG